jgi:hypothetical protein
MVETYKLNAFSSVISIGNKQLFNDDIKTYNLFIWPTCFDPKQVILKILICAQEN